MSLMSLDNNFFPWQLSTNAYSWPNQIQMIQEEMFMIMPAISTD